MSLRVPGLAVVLTLVLAALWGCGSGVDPVDDDDDDAPVPDPLDFAAEVSVANLEAAITDLEALGTRWTFSPNGDTVRDHLVDELAALGFVAELDPFTVSQQDTANLIVRKEGAEQPEHVWIFSAHYDSISDQPDLLAPGADDNASGVAALLEAARILGPHPFRDSIWFVLTGAEEQGSLGSAHMVGWLADEGVDVRGVIAPDMIGYWPLGDGDAMDILGDTESEHLVEAMAEVADALGVAHTTWIEHDYCYGDDHTNFQEAGFPAISPMDCVEAHNVVSSGEETPHYHRTTDTLDTLYLPFAAQVSGVIVATLAQLAQPLASTD